MTCKFLREQLWKSKLKVVHLRIGDITPNASDIQRVAEGEDDAREFKKASRLLLQEVLPVQQRQHVK